MFRSISRQWQLSRAAPGPRDRLLAFLLGVHGGLGEHRRWARKWFHWVIGRFGTHDRVVLRLRVNNKPVSLAMRRGDRADYLVGGELIQGGYEAPPTPPARIIDAGGNIGAFAVAAAARFPAAPLFVYEPNEANLAILAENLEMNGIRAEIQRKGVWSCDTTLYFQARDSYSGFVSSEPSGLVVECVLPAVSADDWLKLDVEGAEYEVLPALFSRGVFPFFVSLELHHRKQRGEELIGLARANGYRVRGDMSPDAECVNLTMDRMRP